MTIVQLPNGQNAEFPDSMSHEQISEILSKQFPSSNKKVPTETKNTPIASSNTNVQSKDWGQKIGEGIGDFSKGLAQGVLNIPSGLVNAGIAGANALGANANFVPQFDFAPHNTASTLGDIASYFSPGIIAKGIGKIPGVMQTFEHANKIPIIADAVKSATNILANNPVKASMAKNALLGAAYAPNENKGMGALLGTGAGFIGGVAPRLTQSNNGIVNAAARSALGGLTGAGVGAVLPFTDAKTGAEFGATAGFGWPILKNRLGLGRGIPGEELLKNLKPEEVYEANKAANALNTPLSPGEAAGRPDLTAMERTYGRTGEGATERALIGNERIRQQKRAIEKLSDTISKEKRNPLWEIRGAAEEAIASREKELTKKVSPLYEMSHGEIVPEREFNSLLSSDKTIENAVKAAKSDPAFNYELRGYPENSIKVLDVAKKKIDADIAKAERYGDKSRIRVLKDSHDRLTKATDEFSPTYAAARAEYQKGIQPITQLKNSVLGKIANTKDINIKNIGNTIFDPAQTNINVLRQVKEEIRKTNPGAWDEMVRDHINKLLSKKEVNGVNFYNQVLKNDNQFNQFLEALDHNKAAKEQLINMRTAWKNLTNIETPRNAAGLSTTGMKQARNFFDGLVDMWNEVAGGKKSKEALKFIYSTQWQKRLNEISKIPNKDKRSEALSSLATETLNK